MKTIVFAYTGKDLFRAMHISHHGDGVRWIPMAYFQHKGPIKQNFVFFIGIAVLSPG